MKGKRNIFAVLGWVVWKLAALLGSRYARTKLDERQAAKRHNR